MTDRATDFRRLWTAYAVNELGSAVGSGALPLVATLVLHVSGLQAVLMLRDLGFVPWQYGLALGLPGLGCCSDRPACSTRRSPPTGWRLPPTTTWPG